MSKLLAETLLIIGAEAAHSDERARSNEYWAEISDKENKELKKKIEDKDRIHADLLRAYEKTRNDYAALQLSLKGMLFKRRKKSTFEKQVEKLLR